MQGALPSALAYADPPGNNGTLQVHELGSPNSEPGNEPHVCTFNFEVFGLDANQTGDVHITNQSPTQPKDDEILTVPLTTDQNGDGNTAYINQTGVQYTLADGHYKATLDNKFGTDKNGKAKSKVFWVECNAPIYTHDQFNLTSMCKPSPTQGQFRIRNQSDVEQAYTLTEIAGGNQVLSGTVDANTDEFVDVTWSASSDTWQLDIGGQTYIKAIGDNELCYQAPAPAQPTATVTINQCVAGSGKTDVVDIRVYNTADQTGATVTYTVSLAGQTKHLTIADGQNANTQFGGVPAATYTATIIGDDGTSITTDEFMVDDCPLLPAQPTATASVVSCQRFPGLTSDKISIRVYNTDDQTDATVTYTIVLNGETKTVVVADGQNSNVEFGNLAAGTYSATVTGDDGTGPITTNEVVVGECQQPQPTPADITAGAVCTELLKTVTVTLTNTGDLAGNAVINGQTYTVNGHSSLEVKLPVDATALSTAVKVFFNDNLIYNQDIPCVTGGQGGGPSIPPVSKPPVKQPVIKHSTKTRVELPSTLPATGSSANPLLAILAGALAYGAVYLIQGRRRYDQIK
ncbi:MAG TPA: hypothetical protein VFL81_03365 [Candidatus Saccharimonadales bacterium]|nr:hypothetical protein [Candidatus Saccharimonadales bacterium]